MILKEKFKMISSRKRNLEEVNTEETKKLREDAGELKSFILNTCWTKIKEIKLKHRIHRIYKADL